MVANFVQMCILFNPLKGQRKSLKASMADFQPLHRLVRVNNEIYCHWLFQKKFLSTTSQDSGGGKSYVLFSTLTSPHRSTPLPNPHPTMSCNVEYNNTRTTNQTTHSKNIPPPHHLYCGHSLLPTKGSTTEGKTRSRPGKGNWSNWPLSILKT